MALIRSHGKQMGSLPAGWWQKEDFVINELNVQSVITSPGHGEIIPLTQEKYTVKGYAYSGELACWGIWNVTQSGAHPALLPSSYDWHCCAFGAWQASNRGCTCGLWAYMLPRISAARQLLPALGLALQGLLVTSISVWIQCTCTSDL